MNKHTTWETYCNEELHLLTPMLRAHGYTLDERQPHLAGERYLMHAVTTTSGVKLILQGVHEDGMRVIIKATRDEGGKRELLHEKACREVLKKIDFGAEVFHTPDVREIIEEGGFIIVITRFIPQEKAFIERDLKEQFHFALRAFKGQEGAHATTWNHLKLIRGVFEVRTATDYLQRFKTFAQNIQQRAHDTTLDTVLDEAERFLRDNEYTLEQYTGFLTHTDFVPHNFRIENDAIILLDHSSLTFGNKYEGWARFINFMALYNPPLESALMTYVKKNRSEGEFRALTLMRVYRLGEIIWYYVKTLERSEGDLLALNTARIYFWRDVLSAVLRGEQVSTEILLTYTTLRDSLRSEGEKERQKGLH